MKAVTKNTFTCQGLIETVGERVQAINAKRKSAIAAMQDLHEDLRHPHQTKISELDAELEALNGLNDDHSLGRRGCGHDLSEQIAAIPDDGEVYEYRCPVCGNSGTVRKCVLAEADGTDG